MKLRDLKKMQSHNDGTRSLFESILVPEILSAFNDWKKSADTTKFVLIGGIALSFYVKPRYTEDIDVLFLAPADIPSDVKGFKHHRTGAFQHNKTHVEIEVVTPGVINIPQKVAQAVFSSAVTSDGLQVASAEGLIALKLFRFNRQDQADIEQLIAYKQSKVDLSVYNLPVECLDRYQSIIQTMKG